MNSYLKRAIEEMEAATSGLGDDELTRIRTAEGKWSAAETLEHLNLTFVTTVKALRKHARDSQRVRNATFSEWLKTTLVVSLGVFPSGRKSPEFALPTGEPLRDIRDRFRQSLAEVDAVLVEYESRYGTARKIAVHPILGPFSVNQWRKFHFVHTRHHMAQIRAMRARPTLKGHLPARAS